MGGSCRASGSVLMMRAGKLLPKVRNTNLRKGYELFIA